jgi:hypothetical protein
MICTRVHNAAYIKFEYIFGLFFSIVCQPICRIGATSHSILTDGGEADGGQKTKGKATVRFLFQNKEIIRKKWPVLEFS